MNEWMNEWMSLCSPPLIKTYREGAVCPSYACLYSAVLSLLQKPVKKQGLVPVANEAWALVLAAQNGAQTWISTVLRSLRKVLVLEDQFISSCPRPIDFKSLDQKSLSSSLKSLSLFSDRKSLIHNCVSTIRQQVCFYELTTSGHLTLPQTMANNWITKCIIQTDSIH